MTTDDKAGMAAFADKERWRKVREFEDQRLRNDKTTVEQRLQIFEMMCEHVRSLGVWPNPRVEPVPKYKLHLARIVNEKL